ncbi:hypothetical protein [Maritalea porphyrae]|uniref:Uncharacterized protein n=1 Tax=Maritalea porphyrae TaxID=880732 RepID=A0ABQ5UU98_9HYPH|nr:hypothetical protein [Maritalea porphyrae]GLQ18748.1 hypothetical protein GCM10007879_29970 [Maritalea porphyrae]
MTKPSSQKAKNGLGTNILILLICLSLLGLATVYALDFFEETRNIQRQADNKLVEFSISATKMQAPRTWITSDFNEEQSVVNLLQLSIPIEIEDFSIKVTTTLLPAARAAPSAYLLDSLYIHNFAPGPSDQRFGLVVKKLRNEAGYEDESIWYDALSASPFVAKCLNEEAANTNAKNCITTVLVNKRVSALIQFEQSLMPYWRPFSVAMERRLASLQAN